MDFTIMSRKEFGCVDGTPGWMFFFEGYMVFHIHLYPEFYTLFWRGKAKVLNFENAFRRIIVAAGKEGHIALGKTLGAYVTIYSSKGRSVHSIIINPRTKAERMRNRAYRLFIKRHYNTIAFVRFDLSGAVPIIVWGDTPKTDARGEIGFSSSLPLSYAAFELLEETRLSCYRAYDDLYAKRIYRTIAEKCHCARM